MTVWDENSQPIRAMVRCYGIQGESWIKEISEEHQSLWWSELFLFLFLFNIVCYFVCDLFY